MKIFNGHSDIISDIGSRRARGESSVFRRRHYENFIKSGVESAVFVIWIEPIFSSRARERFKELVLAWKEELEESRDIINHVKSPEDLKKKKPGQINILLGLEGMEHLEENIDELEDYARELGLFYGSLSWNEKNAFATGAAEEEGGLGPLGPKAIGLMERIGMIIDLSHLNQESFWQLLDQSKRPLIASHSNARALKDCSRNLSDRQILALAERGGLIGLNTYADFVGSSDRERTIDGLIDHMDHIKGLVGVEHLALGLDFCDFLDPVHKGALGSSLDSSSIKGLASEADLKDLIARMEKRGYSREEIGLIAYGNLENFIVKNWKP